MQICSMLILRTKNRINNRCEIQNKYAMRAVKQVAMSGMLDLCLTILHMRTKIKNIEVQKNMLPYMGIWRSYTEQCTKCTQQHHMAKT